MHAQADFAQIKLSGGQALYCFDNSVVPHIAFTYVSTRDKDGCRKVELLEYGECEIVDGAVAVVKSNAYGPWRHAFCCQCQYSFMQRYHVEAIREQFHLPAKSVDVRFGLQQRVERFENAVIVNHA